MKGSLRRRLTAGFMAVALVAGMMPVVGVGTAGACEDQQQIKLPVVARGYDVLDDSRYLDGVITNDTTVSVAPEKVMVSFAENPRYVREEWVCSPPLAPGEWVSFHLDWPKSVPATWTPVVESLGSPTSQSALSLTVNSVSEATTDEAGIRTYTVSVTNPNAFPVADVDVVGIEKDAASSDFVDALDSCDVPGAIGPGETAEFTVRGSSPWPGVLAADLHVTAFEQPTVTLSADTLSPVYGSPVTFQLSLTHSDGTPVVGGRTLTLLASADGEDWHDIRCVDTNTGSATVKAWPGRPLHYKAAYWSGDGLACAESDAVFVKPKVAAGAPGVPATVRAKHAFKVRGRLNAGDKSTGKQVKIIAQRKKGSTWVKGTTVTVSADSAGNYSKNVKLSSAGTYRVRAYRAGVGYTPYRAVKVRR